MRFDAFTRGGDTGQHASKNRTGTGGPFGPSVRLMRRVRFPVKAMLISIAFAVPLMWLLTGLLMTLREQIATTQLEIEGVTYFEALRPVLRGAGELRAAVALDLVSPGSRSTAARLSLTAALDKLDAVHRELGPRLQLQSRYDAAKKQLAALPDGSDGLHKTFATHNKHIAAWLLLVDALVDNSGLALDPDADSYYALQAGIVSTTRVLEGLNRLVTLASAISISGHGGVLPTAELGRIDALLEIDLAAVQAATAKVLDIHPELQAQLALGDLPRRVATLRDHATDAPEDGGTALAELLTSGAAEQSKLLVAFQDKLTDSLRGLLHARIGHFEHQAWVGIAGTLVGLLVAGYLFFGFALSMTTALRAVGDDVGQVAVGDLTPTPAPTGRDEMSAILDRVAEMRGRLTGTIREVRSSADQVASFSADLRHGTEDLAGRSANAADQLQQTANAMAAMQAAVALTAESTREAAALAKRNAEVAAHGGQVIGDVVQTMQGIRDSSKTVNDIVGLIDSIAFQTNILALNAAVEAARAGDLGRGFAVVASEVRSLAQRSAAAAKEIKALIDRSVQQSEQGTQVVTDAGQTMEEIVRAAGRMNELLVEIASATDEQSSGIAQVNASINELDRMTQQNAGLVDETMASATMLHAMSDGLAEEVKRFKLPE